MLFTRSDKRTPFSELERFQPLSGYERVSSESGARAKTGAGNEPTITTPKLSNCKTRSHIHMHRPP
jgi:hypothetical protein